MFHGIHNVMYPHTVSRTCEGKTATQQHNSCIEEIWYVQACPSKQHTVLTHTRNVSVVFLEQFDAFTLSPLQMHPRGFGKCTENEGGDNKSNFREMSLPSWHEECKIEIKLFYSSLPVNDCSFSNLCVNSEAVFIQRPLSVSLRFALFLLLCTR